MNRMLVIRLVAGRELRERVRSKAFRISCGVSLAFILAVAILPGALSDAAPMTYDVGVFGQGTEQLADRLPVVAGQLDDNLAIGVRRLADAAEAERLVKSGDLDAAVGDNRIVVDEDLGDRLAFVVQEANRQVVAEATL